MHGFMTFILLVHVSAGMLTASLAIPAASRLPSTALTPLSSSYDVLSRHKSLGYPKRPFITPRNNPSHIQDVAPTPAVDPFS